MKPKIVLAYSGGLDTSVILKWLQTEYNADVIAYAADLGQGAELTEAKAKAKKLGAKKIYVENLKEEFAKRGISLSMPLWSDGYTIKDSSGSQNMNWAELRRYWAKMILEEEKSDD